MNGSPSSCSDEQTGWDWFSVQLDNGTELMLFRTAAEGWDIDPYSSGTFVDTEGKAHHLQREDFTLEPLAKWKTYPDRMADRGSVARDRSERARPSCPIRS